MRLLRSAKIVRHLLYGSVKCVKFLQLKLVIIVREVCNDILCCYTCAFAVPGLHLLLVWSYAS